MRAALVLALLACAACAQQNLLGESPATKLATTSRPARVPILDSGAYTGIGQVWWMDNHRLIFNGSYPLAKPPEERECGILIWDTRNGEVKAYQSNRAFKTSPEGWRLYCFYHKTQWIRYSREVTVKERPFREWNAHVRRGVIGEEQEETGFHVADDSLRSKRVSNPKSHVGSCVPKPWSFDEDEAVPGRETALLLDEHGYIDIGRRHAVPRDKKPPFRYYKNGASQPTEIETWGRPFLNRFIVNVGVGAGGYLDFANRYQWGMDPVVLFNPDDGGMTRHPVPRMLRVRGCAIGFTYTRPGFVAQCAGADASGLYLWRPEDQRLWLIAAGHETFAKGYVSPDGCKFAFVSTSEQLMREAVEGVLSGRSMPRSTNVPTDRGATLKVANLCEGVFE
ncbi:MAG: hypothetical protein ACREJC_01760 [Tepidisphaeraceae bacterium]